MCERKNEKKETGVIRISCNSKTPVGAPFATSRLSYHFFELRVHVPPLHFARFLSLLRLILTLEVRDNDGKSFGRGCCIILLKFESFKSVFFRSDISIVKNFSATLRISYYLDNLQQQFVPLFVSLTPSYSGKLIYSNSILRVCANTST